MNNTKWEKLMDGLTSERDVHLRYKLLHSDVVEDAEFDCADTPPFFIEPIPYVEVEWIQIPSTYIGDRMPNHSKAGKKIFHQDLDYFESRINSIGKFQYTREPDNITLYAYW